MSQKIYGNQNFFQNLFKLILRKDEPPTIFNRNVDDGWLMWEVPLKLLLRNLDDEFHRLLNFPFDSLRLDSFFCLSNELRLENRNDIRMHFNNKDKNNKPYNIFMDPSHERGEFVLEEYHMALEIMHLLI